jgi:hypothetical protein
VCVFDDYSLPANYGYGDGDASQLAGLAGMSDAPSYTHAQAGAQAQAPQPERPKMRVVPNPGEAGYAGYASAAANVAVATATDEYGYGATKSAARLAAEQALTMPTVSSASSAADVGRLQDAINAYAGRSSGSVGRISKTMKWDTATQTALNKIQDSNGMPQVPQATPRVWAVLFGDSGGMEFDKLERKEDIVSGLESGAQGVLSILQQRFMPSAVSNTPQNASGGQQVGNGGTQQEGSGTDWTTYALVAGGILLLGGVVYFATRSND